MNTISRGGEKAALVAAFAFCGLGCATTPAVEQVEARLPPGPKPPIVEHLGLVLEGYILDGWHAYDSAELGYSIRYARSESDHLDLYVYPVPHDMRRLPEVDRIKRETDRAFAEVRKMVRAGHYTDVRLKTCKYDEAPPVVMTCAMTLKIEGVPLFSVLSLAEVNGRYLKMRATRIGDIHFARWVAGFARFVSVAREHPDALIFGQQDESIEL